jgi:hypothetical protein
MNKFITYGLIAGAIYLLISKFGKTDEQPEQEQEQQKQSGGGGSGGYGGNVPTTPVPDYKAGLQAIKVPTQIKAPTGITLPPGTTPLKAVTKIITKRA